MKSCYGYIVKIKDWDIEVWNLIVGGYCENHFIRISQKINLSLLSLDFQLWNRRSFKALDKNQITGGHPCEQVF